MTPAAGRGPMAALLAPWAVVDEVFGPPDPAAVLLGDEVASVRRAVPDRVREFAATRACARRSLGVLIGDAGASMPLPRHGDGTVPWPADVVGSLTHCPGYRAAAVARRADLRSLGIDAEPATGLPPGTLERITDVAERRHLADLAAGWPDVPWDRLLFSAKESIYKAWWPLVRGPIGFRDAAVGFGPFDHTLRATLRAKLQGTRPSVCDAPIVLTGRWHVGTTHLVTAVWALPRR